MYYLCSLLDRHNKACTIPEMTFGVASNCKIKVMLNISLYSDVSYILIISMLLSQSRLEGQKTLQTGALFIINLTQASKIINSLHQYEYRNNNSRVFIIFIIKYFINQLQITVTCSCRWTDDN